MVLKEWSKLRQLYKETSKQMGRASWFPHHKGLLLGIWAACISVILFSVLIVWSLIANRLGLSFLCSGLLLVMSMLARIAIDKALIKQFASDYDTHGLAQYPFSTWRVYLHYALFLHGLLKQGYSHEAIAKLSSFAEIARPPAPPTLQLSQYPGFMFLMGAFATLFINFITNSPGWKSGAAVFITVGLQLVGLVIAFLPHWHLLRNKQQYQYTNLQRFLQWAERDLEDEQFFRSQRLGSQAPGLHESSH